jgi:truncated hemoglobin YjbI
MRARHGKFPITYEARKIWLESFFKAIEQLKKELDPNIPFDDEKEKSFKEFLISFSEWMVNTN